MSYQIYYDRAFIRVGGQFIPLVNSGSNNCWEHLCRRDVPEKNWGVLNWKRSGRLIFSESEIREIARDYDLSNRENGMSFQTRNKCFAPGAFERWIINGMKSAYTVEEYISFGNQLYVIDYSPKDIEAWKRYSFKTTDGLLAILEQLGTGKQTDIKFVNNRSVQRPKAERTPKKTLQLNILKEYYVLKGGYQGRTVYLMRLLKNGVKFAFDTPAGRIKIFETEKEAVKYLEKYSGRINQTIDFKPECIVNPNYDGTFAYSGYHFTPVRKFHKGETDKPLANDSRPWKNDAQYAMRNMSSDHTLGLSKYNWRKADYSYEGFCQAANGSECDIFRCIENGNLYVPGENELFLYRDL